MLGSKVEPADRDEWESVIDAFAGRYMAAGAANSRSHMAEADRLRSRISELKSVMVDLILLAESAMNQANRDGAEYSVDEELADARALIPESALAQLKTQLGAAS
jgi:uncharacterized protein HemY